MLAVLAALLALIIPLSSPLQAEAPPWYAATQLPARGEITYYGPGVMEWTYEYRIRLRQVPVCDPPDCAGFVATLRPGDLGRKVWLQPPGQPVEGPFLVVDYAAHKDFQRLLQRGLIAEVDYQTARRWGMGLPMHDVLVLGEPPDSMMPSPPQGAAGSRFSSLTHTWLPMIVK